MIKKTTTARVDKKYIVVFVLAVIITWVLHEFAHWVTGEYLGYKMGMSLNATYPLAGQYSNGLHYQLISAAGPLFTLCEALVVYALMIKRRRILLYPFLFTCFYMRLFATLISVRKPNDEARISAAMGAGQFVLPVIMTILLFLLVYKISGIYRFESRFNLVNLGLVVLFSSILIMADMYFRIRLL